MKREREERNNCKMNMKNEQTSHTSELVLAFVCLFGFPFFNSRFLFVIIIFFLSISNVLSFWGFWFERGGGEEGERVGDRGREGESLSDLCVGTSHICGLRSSKHRRALYQAQCS